MTKRGLSWVLVLLLLLSNVASVSAAGKQEMDDFVAAAFRGAKVIGGSLVIYHKGKLVYAYDHGYKDLRRQIPVDENTYFRMGCVTKLVTSVGVMKLVEEGKLELDRDISDYFGYRIANGYYPKVPITLRQLLSHTAGLNETGGFSKADVKVQDLLALKHDRRGNFNKVKPGSKYEYSNFGSGLVGALMELVTGKSVQAYMEEEVFEPLGFHAAYSASLVRTPEDVTNQYKDGELNRAAVGRIKENYENFADPERHFRTTIGTLWIRSRDIAKVALLLSTDGSHEGKQLISPESLMEMRQDQVNLGKSVTGTSPYGLFMEHNDTLLKDRMVYGHQGMTQGAINNVYFEPQSELIFVLFSNGGSKVRENYIGKLARKLFAYMYENYAEQ